MGPGPSSPDPPCGQLTPKVKELWTPFQFPSLGWGKQTFSFTLSAPHQATGTSVQHSRLPCCSSKACRPHLSERCKVPKCQCQGWMAPAGSGCGERHYHSRMDTETKPDRGDTGEKLRLVSKSHSNATTLLTSLGTSARHNPSRWGDRALCNICLRFATQD